MPPETVNDLFAFLTNLMTTHAAMFQALGLNLFRALAIILIVWFGVKSALASASGGFGFQLDHFAALLMTISFGFAMITFYDRPLPGMGVSFYHLVIDQGTNLANALNNGIVTELWDRLNSIYFGTEQPGISIAINALEILRYVVTVLALAAAEIASFEVIAFGYIAAAIAVLLGPVFIPFSSCPRWNGSSGAGLRRSCSMRSIQSWPTPTSSFSASFSSTSLTPIHRHMTAPHWLCCFCRCCFC